MKYWMFIGMLCLCVSIHAESGQDKLYLDKVTDTMERGNYTNAIQMLNKKIQYEEWHLQFLYQLRADSFFALKEFEQARDNYIRALPRSLGGDVELQLGQTYYELGEFKKAVEYFDKTIQQAEEGGIGKALAYYRKGRALSCLGKYKEARTELLKIKHSKITNDIMGDVQVMIEFCLEQERKQEAVASPRDAEGGGGSEEIND